MRSGIIFLIVVLLASMSYAQEIDYTEETFYEITDPITWDYTQVDWVKVPVEKIAEIPPEYIEYTSLSTDQHLAMTAEQIAMNFDNIEDLTRDVNKEQAVLALYKKYGVIVALGNGAQVKEGVLAATYGNKGHVSLSHETYKKAIFIAVDEQGNIIISPSKDQEVNIPSTDNVILDTMFQEITMSDGTRINGKLNFREGKIYVLAENEVIINNIQIKNNYKNDLPIYFDEEEHEGNYIAIGKEKMHIANVDGDYNVIFKTENDFFDVEKDDYLKMEPGFYSEVIIQKREEDIIPLVTVEADIKHGIGLLLTNGDQLFVVEDGQLKSLRNDPLVPKEKGSVPFTLLIKDEMKNDLLSDQKVIFDNSKNFFVVSRELSSEEVECMTCVIDLSQSTTLFDYYQAKVQKIGVKGIRVKEIVPIEEADPDTIWSTFEKEDENGVMKKYAIVARVDAAAASNIISMLDDLPPEIRESVEFIDVVPDDQVGEMCSGPKEILGCIQHGTRTITVGESTSYETLYHEAAHALTYRSEWVRAEEKDFRSYELQLERKYNAAMIIYTDFQRDESGEVVTDAGSEYIPCGKYDFDCFTVITYKDIDTPMEIELSEDELSTYVKLRETAYESSSNTFKERWEAIAGNVYGKNLGTQIVGGRSAVTWADGTDSPRYGCVRAYGCNNYYEDVATFVEPVASGDFTTYTGFYLSELIDPRSFYYTTYPGYRKTRKEAQEWASVYREKLDLLYEYGFIKEEDYQKIMRGTK